MKNDNSINIKIRQIRIINYKGIDELTLDFPRPRMLGDPDVVVMGSRNGLGKTSVLECCALLLIGLHSRTPTFDLSRYKFMPIDIADMMIRAGNSITQINGDIDLGSKMVTIEITINKSGKATITGKPKFDAVKKMLKDDRTNVIDEFLTTVGGMSPNPLISDSFLYFHSYRKVQEGNPELGMMLETDNFRRRTLYTQRVQLPISTFKLRILRSMMSRADLFEEVSDEDSDGILEKLNSLVDRYANGTIQKLRPAEDNTIDFRIQPTSGGPSFTFDGLSSGQKEIIATLFLIWYQTMNRSNIILIDEPELHLNAEWHRDFVKQLTKIAPNNQYIIATHSEEVFASVDKNHRFILKDSSGEKS
ncbi:MAG: AAA family ATPase [Candidatus Aegiribacteria sp.]|nr:AAA family ATPase [Candidatus Aegiribacteria sp.]